MSVILEAVPFILIGVIVSAAIRVFVSDQHIQRFIPRDPMLGILFGCVLGILFPICECGLIPVVRRFVAKGMPLYIGVVFMLVGPIINPVVFAATYTAFRAQPLLVYSRMGLALLIGIFIGLFIYYFVKKNPLKLQKTMVENVPNLSIGDKLITMVEHAASEFIEMGKYLIFGALMTAVIQTFIPRETLIDIGQGKFSSHFFMMGFAYILSLCSTSDAFVAASFTNTFSPGSLLTFMIFGPMLSLKSTFMLLATFRFRFVLLLALLIIAAVFFGSQMFNGIFI